MVSSKKTIDGRKSQSVNKDISKQTMPFDDHVVLCCSDKGIQSESGKYKRQGSI